MKLFIYIMLLVFEAVVAFTYGFVLRKFISLEVYLNIAFLVPFIVRVIFAKRNGEKLCVSLLKNVIISLVLMMASYAIFFEANGIKGEFVDEYEVVVEFINGRGGGTADFTTPSGEEGTVNLKDYRIIILDGEEIIDVGDKIKVREYKGLFDMTYYVFVEEVPTE